MVTKNKINYSLCDFDENILWKFEIKKKKLSIFAFMMMNLCALMLICY